MESNSYAFKPSAGKIPKNSTILTTGGANGIGLATALFLHDPSYFNNIVVLDRSPSPPAGVPELTHSSRFFYQQCDVCSWASQRSAFAAAAARFGGIDCVFINAGIGEIEDQIWTDTKDANGDLAEPVRTVIDVDIRAVGDSLKLSMYHLRNDTAEGGSGKGRGGSIVMTASLAGYLGSDGMPLYSAAKHGVVGYMRALKRACARRGIAISVVAPGITLTTLVPGRSKSQSLEVYGKVLAARGIPINSVQTVATTVADLFGQGMKANGVGVLIQADQAQELEGGLAGTRSQWMGKEMLDLFRGGRAGSKI